MSRGPPEGFLRTRVWSLRCRATQGYFPGRGREQRQLLCGPWSRGNRSRKAGGWQTTEDERWGQGGSGSHFTSARLGLMEELEKLELWQNSKV